MSDIMVAFLTGTIIFVLVGLWLCSVLNLFAQFFSGLGEVISYIAEKLENYQQNHRQ